MDEHEHAAVFDEIGKRYDESFTQRSGQIAAGAWVVDQTGPRYRVLDLGCGAGWPSAQQFAAEGLDVVGIDESDVMLELARARVPSGRFLQGDIRSLPTDLGRIDAVVAFFSLLMLSRAEITAVLAAARGLVSRGAPLALGMVEGDMDSCPVDFFGRTVAVTGYPAEELAEVVGAAGFEVVSVRSEVVEPGSGEEETQVYLLASAY